MKNVLDEINASGLKFLFPLTPKKTYSMVVAEGCKLVGAEFGSIYFKRGNRLVREYSNVPRIFRIRPRPNGFTTQTFRSGKIKIISQRQVHDTHPDALKAGLIICHQRRGKRLVRPVAFFIFFS